MINMTLLEAREANNQYPNGTGRACTLQYTKTGPFSHGHSPYSLPFVALLGPGTAIKSVNKLNNEIRA